MPGRPARPPESQAQRRLFFAAAEGKVAGFKPGDAKEKLAAGSGMTHLPERLHGKVPPKRKR